MGGGGGYANLDLLHRYLDVANLPLPRHRRCYCRSRHHSKAIQRENNERKKKKKKVLSAPKILLVFLLCCYYCQINFHLRWYKYGWEGHISKGGVREKESESEKEREREESSERRVVIIQPLVPRCLQSSKECHHLQSH
jgi:hypothetical protein